MHTTWPGRRRGYAMLVMLWVIVSAGVLTSVVTMRGREAFHAARNRTFRERALWRAEECMSRARAKVDELLSAVLGSPASALNLWRALDTAVTNSIARQPECEATLAAAGSRIDVNGPEEPLRRALIPFVGNAQSGHLLDALVDWRDQDSIPRPFGAERAWYALGGRHVPRNDSIPDLREIRRVRGFEQLPPLDHVLGVEPGRISIANASGVVLSAVPGFTPEVVALILSWRFRGLQVTDVMALTGSLTQASSDSLRAHYPQIAQLTVLEPDAWIVTSVGVAGAPPESVTVEVRLVRTERRAAVVRRRSSL